jgi:hypothetical protein
MVECGKCVEQEKHRDGSEIRWFDMMRSESKPPCCPKPSLFWTVRGVMCRNCSKEERMYRPAKEDFFEIMGSESDAYTYAYNEGHSDSRKNEGYQPTMENQKEESRFRKILKQRAETFAGEESWQSGVREYFGDEEMMDFYDWMQDTYNDDDDDFIEYDDPEEWRGRVHRYFGDEEMMDFYDWLNNPLLSDFPDNMDMNMGAETFGAMLMPKRYLMICPECDETVPEMDNCIVCEADLTVTEAPIVEVVDLEAEEGNFFSEVLIGGLCVFGVSFLLGREAHRRIKR